MARVDGQTPIEVRSPFRFGKNGSQVEQEVRNGARCQVPPWQTRGRAVEVKCSQDRETTFAGARQGGSGDGVVF